ncbi:MAG: flagellar hook capping protein [Lachnospiraceae bacterium]|nr:flagellar hook capping protein [Lachnospiraceae bacterium]
MSIMAPVGEDGKLQTKTASGDSLTQKGKNKNTVDSDMFLTLLVAEMQNQDPLEPTSNTEWVSQYATFTQVQKMSEMAESVDMLRANELIGKEVIMKVTSEKTGETTYKQGTVDYVVMENGKPLLVIDDNKYSISDLDTVVSEDYSKAYEKYSTFKAMIDGLPDISFADKSYQNVIQGALDFYNTMNDYEKNYMKTYGYDQFVKFGEWKLELEKLGVKFEDTAANEDDKASLDDILKSFNTKMNAIIDKLNLLTENKGSESDDSSQNKDDESSNTETA